MAKKSTKKLTSAIAGSAKLTPSSAFNKDVNANSSTRDGVGVALANHGSSLGEQVLAAGHRGRNGGEADNKPTHLPGVSPTKHDAILDNLLRHLGEYYFQREVRNRRYDRILAELAVQQVIAEQELTNYESGEQSALRDIRYPKTYGHLRDMTINCMNTLFPMRQMYGSIATSPSQQQLITAFLQMMNRDAKNFNHYSNYYKIIFDGFALNAGFGHVNWDIIRGTAVDFSANAGGSLGSPSSGISSGTRPQDIHAGNRITRIDPYNCFWDDALSPNELNSSANFFAYVERVSTRELRAMARRGLIVLPKDIRTYLREFDVSTKKYIAAGSPRGSSPYYTSFARMMSSEARNLHTSGLFADRPSALVEPIVRMNSGSKYSDNGVFQIDKYLNSGDFRKNSSPNARQGDNELLHIFLRTTEAELELSTDDTEVIKHIIILNGESIVAIKPAGEAHGLYPIVMTAPACELGDGTTPSVASILAPYQYITNSLLSTFIEQAIDDAHNGVLAYDSAKVNMASAVRDKSGRLAVTRNNPDSDNVPIGNYFAQLRGAPANPGLLNAEGLMRERVNDFAPTASANQLANLNRPVSHQSRQLTAVMNLHTQVTSRLVAEQMIQPANYIQSRNIMLYGSSITTVDENGLEQEVSPSAFFDLDTSVTASDGMRGLDTIAIIDRFEKLLNSAYQSPQLMAEYDIAAMTSFMFQMEGVAIDVDSFKYPDPFSALPPEAKQAAYELLQAQLASQEGAPPPQR